jgi:hypothetical protein
MVPSQDHLVQVARSVRRDLDRQARAFVSIDRMELTQRLRTVSGEGTTRITEAIGAELERALNDQGLRCYPSLVSTTTGDRVRIFRAGSPIGDLIDAVLVPSPDHDRELAEALEKFRGKSDWTRSSTATPGLSTADMLGRLLPREKQLGYVHSLEEPDLATT